MCYTQSLKRGKELPLKSLKPMGAGGEMWFSGPTSTDEWLACIPPQSASSPHWRASASLSWGSPSEIWPEATCGPVFLWNSLRRCVSIAWSYDQHFNRSPHQEWASWCPLAASHPSIQSSSHRLDLSVLEYSFPRFLTSWSLLCWSQYSLFWGKKKAVWKGKLTVDEFWQQNQHWCIFN